MPHVLGRQASDDVPGALEKQRPPFRTASTLPPKRTGAGRSPKPNLLGSGPAATPAPPADVAHVLGSSPADRDPPGLVGGGRPFRRSERREGS